MKFKNLKINKVIYQTIDGKIYHMKEISELRGQKIKRLYIDETWSIKK